VVSAAQLKITLTPIGSVDPDLVRWCAKHLPDIIHADVLISEPIQTPGSGFDPSRKQYLGDTILKELNRMNVKSDKVVGLLDQDCYASGLNFIFGQASLNGKGAFVALPRLRQSYYGLADDPEIFKQRVLKEIIHELGHTWNLTHCPDRKCIMHFSNRLEDTDIKGPDFCKICKRRVPS
jgi:archaemetzincin